MIIRDCHISVNLAKYERKIPSAQEDSKLARVNERKDIRHLLALRDGRSFKQVLMENGDKNKEVRGRQIWMEKKILQKPTKETRTPSTIVVNRKVCNE